MSSTRAAWLRASDKVVNACNPVGISWPPLTIGIACFAGFAGVTLFSIFGTLPYWLAAYFNTMILIRLMAPFHESLHGNISGRVKSARWLDPVIGHLAGTLLLFEYSMVRFGHSAHHRELNVPGRDPDFWMHSTSSKWIGLIRSPALTLRYIVYYFRNAIFHPRIGTRTAVIRIAWLLSVYGTATALVIAGPWFDVVVLWIGPAIWATSGYALMHWTLHPLHHDENELAGGTRIVIGHGWRRALMQHLYVYQNYHLIHHLYPRLPYHRHKLAFREIRGILEEHGARITEYGR